MKKKEAVKKLREKSLAELQKILGETREKLRRLRFDLVQGKVKNIRELRATKKYIAQIITIINEKRRG